MKRCFETRFGILGLVVILGFSIWFGIEFGFWAGFWTFVVITIFGGGMDFLAFVFSGWWKEKERNERKKALKDGDSNQSA